MLPRVSKGRGRGCPPLPSRSARNRSTSLSCDGETGPARSLHSSRADGMRPANPGQGVRAPPRPPGARRAARDPAVAAAPARPGRRELTHLELVRVPDTAGNPGRPTTERGAPAGRARAAPPGPVRPVGRNLNSGRRGAPAPVPPRPVPSGLTQTTEGTLAPSPRTQSSGSIPRAKYSHSDACTAAILPRGGRRLLTLAPTRRARAPIRAFSARTEAVVQHFRAAAAPRPVAGAVDWLPARDLAISREEAEVGTAAGASALAFPPRLCRGPRLRLPLPLAAAPPRPARPPERPRKLRSAGGGIHTVRWPWWAPAVGPSVPAEHGGAKRGLERGSDLRGVFRGPRSEQVSGRGLFSGGGGVAPWICKSNCPLLRPKLPGTVVLPREYRRGGLAFGTRILRHGTGDRFL